MSDPKSESGINLSKWLSRLDSEFSFVAAKHSEKTRSRHHWVYPWTDLEEQLSDRPLHLIGYGSLMNRASAFRTLGDYDALNPIPGVAFGGERVYEYFMSDAVVNRYGVKTEPNERAALNVRKTSTLASHFNGVLLTISRDAVEPLREREKNYDLFAMPFLPWGTDEFFEGTAYCLVANQNSDGTIRSHLMPHPGYHEVCLSGAKSQTDSTAFCDMFLSTTSLWDGTKLSDWKHTLEGEISHG
jgi:hypothetical protein